MIKKYEKYKDSGIEWIGEIPSIWEIGKLKFNASLKISTVDRHEFENEISISVCHYPQAYNNEKINKNTVLSSGTCTLKELENFKLKKGQIIITKDSETSNDIGVPAFVEDDMIDAVCGYHLAIIEVDENYIQSTFLFRFLQSKNVNYYFDTKSNGVTRFGLGKPAMENLQIPIPPLQEQTKIAQFLDHQTSIIDQLIQQKEKLIELLKEKRQAVINEAVTKGLNPKAKMKNSGIEWLGEVPEGWEVKKLKYLVALNTNQEVLSESPFKVALENIESGTGKFIESNSENQFEGVGNFFKNGDVLFNKLRPYLAKVYLAQQEGYSVGELLVLTPKPKISSEFLFYRLLSPAFIEIVNGSTYGAKMPRASWNFISNLPLPVPSKKEQAEIVKFIEEFYSKSNTLIIQSTSQIDKLKEYRQAIISEAVTGKIDVRDWQLSEPQIKND